MRVSVIIPAFNEEHYIGHALKTLEKQTFRDFEIIVADNNSTDKTAEIAKHFGARVVPVAKQGAVFAYNEGMKHGKGDILVNVDADTQVPHDWLEKIVKALEPEDVVAVTGSATVKSGSQLFDQICYLGYTLFIGFNFLIHKPHLSGFNFGVKKKAFDTVGGMDTDFLMSFEVDFGLRVAKVGKVLFLPDLVVITSTRRWKKDTISTFGEYIKGYIYTIWLRKPPPFKQVTVR